MSYFLQVLDHLVIQKLNAEGRLEKKEAKKGSNFDKVRTDKCKKSYDILAVNFSKWKLVKPMNQVVRYPLWIDLNTF